MNWTEAHDVIFCKEYLQEKLYKYKSKNQKAARLWKKVAYTLNHMNSPEFQVIPKSLKNRLHSLMQKYNRKMKKNPNMENATEVEILMLEIIEKRAYFNRQQNNSIENINQQLKREYQDILKMLREQQEYLQTILYQEQQNNFLLQLPS